MGRRLAPNNTGILKHRSESKRGREVLLDPTLCMLGTYCLYTRLSTTLLGSEIPREYQVAGKGAYGTGLFRYRVLKIVSCCGKALAYLHSRASSSGKETERQHASTSMYNTFRSSTSICTQGCFSTFNLTRLLPPNRLRPHPPPSRRPNIRPRRHPRLMHSSPLLPTTAPPLRHTQKLLRHAIRKAIFSPALRRRQNPLDRRAAALAKFERDGEGHAGAAA